MYYKSNRSHEWLDSLCVWGNEITTALYANLSFLQLACIVDSDPESLHVKKFLLGFRGCSLGIGLGAAKEIVKNFILQNRFRTTIIY